MHHHGTHLLPTLSLSTSRCSSVQLLEEHSGMRKGTNLLSNTPLSPRGHTYVPPQGAAALEDLLGLAMERVTLTSASVMDLQRRIFSL